jgi:Na+/H+ antiporter NhaC
VVCLAACLNAGARTAGGPTAASVVPPLVAVTLALASGRMLLSLGVAVFVGGWLSAAGGAAGLARLPVEGTIRAGRFVVDTVYDTGRPRLAIANFNADNLEILLYVVLIMAMISVMLAAGGLQGVANWLMKYARSPRATRLVTAAAGLIVFVDDYANTMIVGSTLRPATDRMRISREKLAFLVDATAAPVAGIAVISTWIGVEVGLLSEIAVSLEIPKDGYALFFDALGFRFYCLAMIGFVFLNAASGLDFGPMARAEERARRLGKLLDDGATPMTSRSLAAAEPHAEANVRAAVAVVPMVLLLAVFMASLWISGDGMAAIASDPLAIVRFSVWQTVLSGVNSIPLLAMASAAGLATASAAALFVARIPPSAMLRAAWLGVKSAALPVSVLVLAWSLKGACEELETGRYLAAALGDSISPLVFPALVFLVAAVTSFATGTSWGTMAILIPTAIPVAFHLDGDSYGLITTVSIAAVLDGSIFGDHCSPISDTTIMSSTASACDHLAHVRTQMPYSLAVAAIALGFGYLPAALAVPKWAVFSAGAGVLILLFCGLRAAKSAKRQP